MFRVAAAAGTNDGGRPTFLICDELHGWVEAKERVHLVLANGLAKRRDGCELSISTAGHDKATLLGRLYDHGRAVEAGEIIDDGFLMDWLEAPDGFDLDDPEQLEAALRSCNPHLGQFVSLESPLQRLREIPRFEFERYYLNRWTDGAVSWLPAAAWDALEDPDARIPEGSEVTLGVDVGTKLDTSAIARVWRRPDGKVVAEAEVFAPRGDGVALELAIVEDAIRRNADRFDVRAVVYDKWSFEKSAQELSDFGLLMIEQPMPVERMSVASVDLHEAITSGELVHNGDPVLAAHVRAGATRTPELSSGQGRSGRWPAERQGLRSTPTKKLPEVDSSSWNGHWSRGPL